MAIVYGIVAAVFLGTSDFFAAKVSRLIPSVTVTRTALLASLVIAPLLLLLKPVEWRLADIAIASLSGVVLTVGLGLLYTGYATAPIGIIAPTVSVLLAAVPVVVDLVAGDRPGGLALVGMAFGMSALVLTSWTPGGEGSVSRALLLGATAGLMFGLSFTLLDRTSEASGLMPVVVQRAAAFSALAIAQRRDRHPMIATTNPARNIAVITGLLAGLALGALQLGYRTGSAGPVSVATSQFATVAVVLSFLFNKERLRWWQGLGVAATAVGVALMALD
jgi:drug/metabolite transporter (DMT)-like permease